MTTTELWPRERFQELVGQIKHLAWIAGHYGGVLLIATLVKLPDELLEHWGQSDCPAVLHGIRCWHLAGHDALHYADVIGVWSQEERVLAALAGEKRKATTRLTVSWRDGDREFRTQVRP